MWVQHLISVLYSNSHVDPGVAFALLIHANHSMSGSFSVAVHIGQIRLGVGALFLAMLSKMVSTDNNVGGADISNRFVTCIHNLPSIVTF